MWMKGYVALHDFKQEYVRNAVLMMLPYVTQAAEARIATTPLIKGQVMTFLDRRASRSASVR